MGSIQLAGGLRRCSVAASVLPSGFPNCKEFILGGRRAVCMLYLFFSELSEDHSFRGGTRVQILAWKVNLQYERKCRIS